MISVVRRLRVATGRRGITMGLALLPMLLVAACSGHPGTPADAPAPPPPTATPPAPEQAPVIVTMSRPTLLRRTLPDGATTRGGAEVLVVHADGQAEIRDVDASGPVIKSAPIDKQRLARLAALLGRREWAALAATRGTPVPDGPAYTITVNQRSVTRFDNPSDEPLVREVAALLKAIWSTVDP